MSVNKLSILLLCGFLIVATGSFATAQDKKAAGYRTALVEMAVASDPSQRGAWPAKTPLAQAARRALDLLQLLHGLAGKEHAG